MSGILGNYSALAEGIIKQNKYLKDKRPYEKPNWNELKQLNKKCEKFFTDRKITLEVVKRNSIMMKKTAEGEILLAFPYIKKGEIVNIKYRNLDKKSFSQVKLKHWIFN